MLRACGELFFKNRYITAYSKRPYWATSSDIKEPPNIIESDKNISFSWKYGEEYFNESYTIGHSKVGPVIKKNDVKLNDKPENNSESEI